MKIVLGVVCALGILAGASEAAAQRNRRSRPAPRQKNPPKPSPSTDRLPVLPDIRNDPDVQAADIAIIANITAKELRFDVVGNPNVEFLDKAKNTTIWQAERFNLPDKIEPGVTYRNMGIRLKIVSRFADIERIVAEALGEVPISENNVPKEPLQNLSPKPPPTESSLPGSAAPKPKP